MAAAADPVVMSQDTAQKDLSFFTTGNIADYAPTASSDTATPSSSQYAEVPARSKPTGISVVVAGAGTAGLVTALECWRKGLDVTHILERAAQPVFTGDMLVVQPSALRVFKHWPALMRDLNANGIDADVSYKRHTGEHVFGPVPPPFRDPELMRKRAERGEPISHFAQPRVALYKSLLRQVAALGLSIEWGAKTVDFFEDEAQGKAGVVCKDGRSFEADLVVAAEGLHTASCKIVTGEDDKPVPSGQSIYRTAYPLKYAMADPAVKRRWGDGQKATWEFWLGKGVFGGLVLDSSIVTWVVSHQDDELTSSAESWTPDVRASEVAAMLDRADPGWSPDFKALMETAPPGSIVHWRLNWRDLNREWTSPTGRVVQAGDAAHAFMPTAGNGASQCIEDATALATCLEIAGSPEKAGMAAKVYNALRYERISCIQKAMFVNAQNKSGMDWDAIKREPSKIHRTGNSWTFEHDAEQYSYDKYQEAFDALFNGGPALQNTNFPKGHTFRPWTLDEVKREMAAGRKIVDLLDGDWS